MMLIKSPSIIYKYIHHFEKIKISENFLGKNLKMKMVQIFKTWSSFKVLNSDFEYLSVFIDDNIAHITMVCCCSNKICGHSNKVKRWGLVQKWEQYLCRKTALTTHLLLLYHYSQTLPHFILLLRHHFQGHRLELSLKLALVRVYLYVCWTLYLFWSFQQFALFKKLRNYKKHWLTPSNWCIYFSVILQYCMIQYRHYTGV